MPAIANDSQLYARSFADVYDLWYGELDDPGVLVDSVARRHPRGAEVLELGSGTGRLATPLHRAGFHVTAVDVSPTMLAAAPPGPVRIAADMAELPLADATIDVVLIAYNTLFNLSSRQLQARCVHEASRVLRPGGSFVVEAFVADIDGAAGYDVSFRDRSADQGSRTAIVTGPDPDDEDVIIGSHVELGPTITCRPWRLVYRSPASLDDIASAARLELRDRCGDWAGTPFGSGSTRHVSWYERI